MRRSRYGSIQGTIVDIVPTRMGNRRADGCMMFVTIEDMDGNTVNFMVTPSTYVVDFDTLSVGMNCTFWYMADAPMPLIYPPQYNAVVAAQTKNGRMVNVAHYNGALVSDDQTLQLNMDGSVDVRTTNNQYFQEARQIIIWWWFMRILQEVFRPRRHPSKWWYCVTGSKTFCIDPREAAK